MSARETLKRPGNCGRSSSPNQRASTSSAGFGDSSQPAQSATNASISECGNGHDWLVK